MNFQCITRMKTSASGQVLKYAEFTVLVVKGAKAGRLAFNSGW